LSLCATPYALVIRNRNKYKIRRLPHAATHRTQICSVLRYKQTPVIFYKVLGLTIANGSEQTSWWLASAPSNARVMKASSIHAGFQRASSNLRLKCRRESDEVPPG
jgi:creatinine amidohydrolase/Fe(II)-dependent formamide hydrolase-like protein